MNIDINQLKEITISLKRLEATVLMAKTVIGDTADKLDIIGEQIRDNAWKLDLMLGAHCLKCGDMVLGKEDGLCQKCV